MNAPSDLTLYIAGPMTGVKDFNYPAFNTAAKQLRAAGYTVLNPAENEAPNPDPSWSDWMRLALGQLIQADGIALLPGWAQSRGAAIEKHLAANLGMGRNSVPGWLTQADQQTRMARLIGDRA